MMGKKGRLGLMLIVLAVILTAMLSIFMGSTGAYLQDFSKFDFTIRYSIPAESAQGTDDGAPK